MRYIVLFIGLVFLGGCSAARVSYERVERVPRNAERATKRDTIIPVEIRVKTSDVILGAYTIRLDYDASLLCIEDIEGGTRDEFAGVPIFDKTSFATGRTTLTGFTVERRGRLQQQSTYHIATVFFMPLRFGRAHITADVITLADLEAKRIKGNVILSPEFIDTTAYIEEK